MKTKHTPATVDPVRRLQIQTRSVLADRSGDGDWMRVPPESIPLGGYDTAEDVADFLEANSYEPRHLADLEPDTTSMPDSLAREVFKRVKWSGNPQHSPIVMGWTVRLGRYTTADEKRWFAANGFKFSGGKWGRPDDWNA